MWEGDLKDSSTISDLLEALETTTRKVNFVSVNGEIADPDCVIPEGADVLMVTVVGGG